MTFRHAGRLQTRRFVLYRHAGLSLVELIIAMAIGAGVCLTGMRAWSFVHHSHMLNTERYELQQQGIQTLDAMAAYARQAGFGQVVMIKSGQHLEFGSELTDNALPEGRGLYGCDNAILEAGSSSQQGCRRSSRTAMMDSLTIGYRAFLTTEPGAEERDCLGNRIFLRPASYQSHSSRPSHPSHLSEPSHPPQARASRMPEVIHRFTAHRKNSSALATLYCQGSGGQFASPSQPILDNVEQFRVRYQVRAQESMSINLTAAAVSALPGNAGWASVTGVDLCLRLRGDLRSNVKQRNIDCDGRLLPLSDRYQRVTVRTTVFLPNSPIPDLMHRIDPAY